MKVASEDIKIFVKNCFILPEKNHPTSTHDSMQ